MNWNINWKKVLSVGNKEFPSLIAVCLQKFILELLLNEKKQVITFLLCISVKWKNCIFSIFWERIFKILFFRKKYSKKIFLLFLLFKNSSKSFEKNMQITPKTQNSIYMWQLYPIYNENFQEGFLVLYFFGRMVLVDPTMSHNFFRNFFVKNRQKSARFDIILRMLNFQFFFTGTKFSMKIWQKKTAPRGLVGSNSWNFLPRKTT